MAQFYFLSVLFNVIAGLILIYGKDLTVKTAAEIIKSGKEKSSEVETASKSKSRKVKAEETEKSAKSEKSAKEKKHVNPFKNVQSLDNGTLRLVCGVLCIFVGIMKLLSVFRNDVPVIGDIIPSAAGLMGGTSLLLEYYMTHATVDNELPVWSKKLFIESRKYVGIACLVAGVLHFIFPQIVLL